MRKWLASPGAHDARRKVWHGALMLGSAYAAVDPRFAWAVPVLTGVAGVSAPPAGITRHVAAALVVGAALAASVVGYP